MDDLPISRTERSVIAGEGIAAMMATEHGRALLLELADMIRFRAITDVPFNALVRERIKGDRLAAIVDAAVQHGAKPVDTRPFGDVMRQLPEQTRELIADHIMAAGWGR